MNSNHETMTTTCDSCIDVCNGLLRGELAAVESYGQAIEELAGSPVTEELRRIRADHSRSANWLTASVREMGGEPENGAGARGPFAAKLTGGSSTLEALREGEVVERNAYQEALLNDDLLTDCKRLIREDLLPPVIGHIIMLEKLERAG